jgi:hypothetical protein
MATMAFPNISDYITPKTEKYYNDIITIVNVLQNTKFFFSKDSIEKKVSIYVFGGAIRSIIQNYFNQTEEFIPSKDIDLWFDFSNIWWRGHSFETWKRTVNYILNELKYNSNINLSEKHEMYPEFGNRETYGIHTININNYDIDISTEINKECNFKNLSDFTVNNLYIDINGNLNTRATSEYTIKECIDHIKHKKLINIYNFKHAEQFVQYFCNDKDLERDNITLEEAVAMRFKQREEKMLSYDYNY